MQRTKKPEEKKIKTRQKIKKGRSKRCCRCQSTWLVIAPMLHRFCSAVALLSLRCRTAIAMLSLYCPSAVAPLLHRYRSAVAPPLSLHCCTAVAPLLHRYRTTVAPLLSLLLSLRSHTTISRLSLRCLTIVEPLSLRTREGIKNSKLNFCCSTVTPLLLLLSIRRFTPLSPQEA